MKEKYLWAAVAALALLSAGQAYYIFSHPRAAAPPAARAAAQDPWKELDAWRKSVDERLRAKEPLAPPDFDSFFDEGFFRRRLSAFDQMERIHRQMLDSFLEPQRGAFGESWDKWFAERMKMGGFKTRVYGGKDEIVMLVEIPGLEKAKADISVTRDRVRLAFSTKSSSEEKAANGSVKSESSQSFVKILPVPDGADGENAKVSIMGESVRITFPRLRAPA